MKRWIIISSLLFIILTLGFIPVERSVNFKINAAYFNVYQYLTKAENWVKWQPDLKLDKNRGLLKTDSNENGFRITAPGITFKVENTGLNEFTIVKTQDNQVYSRNYILVPQPATNKTIVIVAGKTNLFGYLWSSLFYDDLKGSPILDLKNYMESVELYYGFTIQKQLSPEKLIAVMKEAVPEKFKFLQGGIMLNELNAFVAKNHLKVTYPLQIQCIPSTADSIQMLVGLPVDRKITAADDILYMTMPRSKALVGEFKGRYKDRQKIYNAMQSYIKDNFLHPLILPFETFSNNKLPGTDSSMVDMQVVVQYR